MHLLKFGFPIQIFDFINIWSIIERRLNLGCSCDSLIMASLAHITLHWLSFLQKKWTDAHNSLWWFFNWSYLFHTFSVEYSRYNRGSYALVFWLFDTEVWRTLSLRRLVHIFSQNWLLRDWKTNLLDNLCCIFIKPRPVSLFIIQALYLQLSFDHQLTLSLWFGWQLSNWVPWPAFGGRRSRHSRSCIRSCYFASFDVFCAVEITSVESSHILKVIQACSKLLQRNKSCVILVQLKIWSAESLFYAICISSF